CSHPHGAGGGLTPDSASDRSGLFRAEPAARHPRLALLPASSAAPAIDAAGPIPARPPACAVQRSRPGPLLCGRSVGPVRARPTRGVPLGVPMGSQKNKGLQRRLCNPLIILVGTAGFELATPCTPCA